MSNRYDPNECCYNGEEAECMWRQDLISEMYALLVGMDKKIDKLRDKLEDKPWLWEWQVRQNQEANKIEDQKEKIKNEI